MMGTVKVSRDIVAPVVPVFREFTTAHLGPGSLIRETLGGGAGAPLELTACEPNRMCAITRHAEGFRIDATFRFEPIRGGTRVTVEFACAPRDGSDTPAGWLLRANEARVAQALTHDLADLKRSLETPRRHAFRRAG